MILWSAEACFRLLKRSFSTPKINLVNHQWLTELDFGVIVGVGKWFLTYNVMTFLIIFLDNLQTIGQKPFTCPYSPTR